MPTMFVNGPSPAVGGEQLVVSTTAIGPTSTSVSVAGDSHSGANSNFQNMRRADEVFVTIHSQPVRLRFDGTAPTATVGHYMAPGDSIAIPGYQNISNLLFIRDSTASGAGEVFITYLRRG